MRNQLRLFIVSGLLLFSNLIAFGQTNSDSTTYQVETKDGNTYIGNILSMDSVAIVFKTTSIGTITIQKKTIQKITSLSPDRIKDGEVYADNPQSTRYFFSPTGYGMKSGEGYYQNVWVLFNQFSFSFTDNVSLGAGIVPIFLIAGASSPAWIAPRFSVPVIEDKFNVGGGAFIGTILGEEKSGFGIVYGVSSFGSRDKNFTLGLGYGYSGGNFAETPTITASTMIRTGPRGYFISENYYISTGADYMLIASFGGRAITRGGVGIDWGIVLPIGEGIGEFVAIPWLGITLPFKPKK